MAKPSTQNKDDDYSFDFEQEDVENSTITEGDDNKSHTSHLISILSEIDGLLDNSQRIDEELNSGRSQCSISRSTGSTNRNLRTVSSNKSDQSEMEELLKEIREIEKANLPFQKPEERSKPSMPHNKIPPAQEEVKFKEPLPPSAPVPPSRTFGGPLSYPSGPLQPQSQNKQEPKSSEMSTIRETRPKTAKPLPKQFGSPIRPRSYPTPTPKVTQELPVPNLENLEVEKLQNEMAKQESLIQVYQRENENLFTQLKEVKGEGKKREEAMESSIKELQTEITTLKMNRFGIPAGIDSARLESSRSKEMERLNKELDIKSGQIVELREEIALLKIENSKRGKATNEGEGNVGDPEEKEKEYQRTINGLQKQVRTLQRILYHKNPSAPSTYPQLFGSLDDRDDGGAQVPLLEGRIVELEKELEKADEGSKQKIRELQSNFQNVKCKYEERIHELEKRVQDVQLQVKTPEKKEYDDAQGRLDRAQAEISVLKMEINRYKRELEISSKASLPNPSASSKDAAALSSALKQFKGEIAEKEKEMLKFKKEIEDLKKTNNHLKREREKYLGLVNSGSNALRNVRKSEGGDGGGQSRGGGVARGGRFSMGGVGRIKNQAPGSPRISAGTTHMLQTALENERMEFEYIIAEKVRQIEMKDKQVKDLKSKVEALQNIECELKVAAEENGLTLEELRSRVGTQNKVIETLKFHLSKLSGIEDDFIRLRTEKDELEYRNKELGKRIAYLDSLNKPENEVLSELSEKVEDLSARYMYREKQLDNLINRLTLKTSAPSSSSLDLESLGLSPRMLSIINSLLKNTDRNFFSNLDTEDILTPHPNSS